jgi:hypothetical protein
MSINELLGQLTAYWPWVLGYLLGLPAMVLLLNGFYRPRLVRQPLDYVYSTIIYASTVPGVLAAILVFYSLFIIRNNLLQVNVVVYFLPLISMGMVLWLIRLRTGFDRLPGFERLSGLITLIAVACLITLLIHKLIIFVGFVAPMEMLLVIGAALFLVVKKAFRQVQGGR